MVELAPGPFLEGAWHPKAEQLAAAAALLRAELAGAEVDFMFQVGGRAGVGGRGCCGRGAMQAAGAARQGRLRCCAARNPLRMRCPPVEAGS